MGIIKIGDRAGHLSESRGIEMPVRIIQEVVMKPMKRTMEQRKHRRFQVKDGTYAVLKYKPAVMGEIMNMSKDGLAVQYSNTEQHLSESFELDIFRTDNSFYIEKLQVKTISDFQVEDTSALGPKNTRQRGVQFEGLNPIQLFQLYYFLQNYTMDRRSAKDRRQLNDTPYSGPERRQVIERRKSLPTI